MSTLQPLGGVQQLEPEVTPPSRSRGVLVRLLHGRETAAEGVPGSLDEFIEARALLGSRQQGDLGFPETTFASSRLRRTGGSARLALSALEEFREETRHPDWDGQGADPIAESAFDQSRALIAALPADLPVPDVSPAASGEVGLEWYVAKGQRLLVTLSGDCALTYAAILGEGNTVHGTERFAGTCPRSIVQLLRRLYP